MTIVTWDWKEQPPWDRINDAFEKSPEIRQRIFQIETGHDSWGCVVAPAQTSDVEAQIYFEQNS